MATKEKSPSELLTAFQAARQEARKLQAQARKTNKALARLDEELAKRGIQIKVQEKGTQTND